MKELTVRSSETTGNAEVFYQGEWHDLGHSYAQHRHFTCLTFLTTLAAPEQYARCIAAGAMRCIYCTQWILIDSPPVATCAEHAPYEVRSPHARGE